MESHSTAQRAELARVEAELAASLQAYRAVADLSSNFDERRVRRHTLHALRKRRDALRKVT